MKTLKNLIHPELLIASKVDFNQKVTAINRDCDQLVDKELFFAIRGASFDGTQKISKALERGAVAVVVEDPSLYEKNERAILVKDVREQLSRSASAWYEDPSQSFKLVGVTGTNGKTTTAFLLNELWEKSGHRAGMVGTVQNKIADKILPSVLTTPGPLELQKLFFEMVQYRVSEVVMEVSSIALDQKRVSGCCFSAAIFTNFSSDHLDYHGTLESYFESKLKLFKAQGLELAIINADDPKAHEILKYTNAKRVLLYGIHHSTADFKVENFRTSLEGTSAEVITPQGKVELKTALVGKHNLYNCLAVLAAYVGMGGGVEKALDSFPLLLGAPGRLERVGCSDSTPFVFVDYAHSEDALKNILETLHSLKKPKSKLITVFGCGGDRDKTKRAPMGTVVSSLSDLTVITSDNPRNENPEKIISEIKLGLVKNSDWLIEIDRKLAIQKALSLVSSNDIVLVAGKGHETYQVIGNTHFPFDDREVIREYYENAKRDRS